MGTKRVEVDGKPVEIQEGESVDTFLGRLGLPGGQRQLTKLEGANETPVQSLDSVRDGDRLGTVSTPALG